jgi:hypothetical protein
MALSRPSQTRPGKPIPTGMRLPTLLLAKPKSAPNVIMFTGSRKFPAAVAIANPISRRSEPPFWFDCGLVDQDQ